MLYVPRASHERGQGLVEYALILVLVSLVVIVILILLGPAIGNVFSNIVQGIGNRLPTGG
jgi:pilus assembly protein Flp/PilA